MDEDYNISASLIADIQELIKLAPEASPYKDILGTQVLLLAAFEVSHTALLLAAMTDSNPERDAALKAGAASSKKFASLLQTHLRHTFAKVNKMASDDAD